MTDSPIRWWTGIVAGALILAVGWFGVLNWTLIPLGLDARVEDTSWEGRTAGHFRVLYLSDGSERVVDREFFERVQLQLGHGSTIAKDTWDTDVVIAGRPVPLQISTDVWRTIIAVTVPVGVGWWVRWSRRKRTSTTALPSSSRAENQSARSARGDEDK